MARKTIGLLLCVLFLGCMFFASCDESAPTQATSVPTSVLTPTPTVLPTAGFTETPLVTSTALPQTYIVQEGDTLWSISQLYGVPMARIAYRNNLSNADLIYPGQELVIPRPDEVYPEIPSTGKQIVVILSLQTLYAYEDGVLVGQFLVSTGVEDYPTVQGTYAIYEKLEFAHMTGPGYDLDNVPWTMYFFEGYGIHGTYWHNNFGQPMSHGCVNMKTEEAEWLYNWAPLGTPVIVEP